MIEGGGRGWEVGEGKSESERKSFSSFSYFSLLPILDLTGSFQLAIPKHEQQLLGDHADPARRNADRSPRDQLP